MSEFEALRADVAALRSDIDSRFATLTATVAAKPDTATIYQAALAMFVGMFGVIVGTVVLMKNIGA